MSAVTIHLPGGGTVHVPADTPLVDFVAFEREHGHRVRWRPVAGGIALEPISRPTPQHEEYTR